MVISHLSTQWMSRFFYLSFRRHLALNSSVICYELSKYWRLWRVTMVTYKSPPEQSTRHVNVLPKRWWWRQTCFKMHEATVVPHIILFTVFEQPQKLLLPSVLHRCRLHLFREHAWRAAWCLSERVSSHAICGRVNMTHEYSRSCFYSRGHGHLQIWRKHRVNVNVPSESLSLACLPSVDNQLFGLRSHVEQKLAFAAARRLSETRTTEKPVGPSSEGSWELPPSLSICRLCLRRGITCFIHVTCSRVRHLPSLISDSPGCHGNRWIWRLCNSAEF